MAGRGCRDHRWKALTQASSALPSAALVLAPEPAGRRVAGGRCQRLAGDLRRLPTPVIGRIGDDAVRLDLRTLEDDAAFLETLSALGQTPDR